ncbi:pseudouridine synthase [Aquitalea palustris]|uniref:Pseudouridine synthase n=2 Tax=Aquitalea palustris TaxID=2480983 RepID=A0A454JHP8_9NEIS|nr:pseudouridine synthase [Aquitalea palustris]
MSKGQNNARQPVARVKGRESSPRRQPDAPRGNAPQQQGRGKPGGFGKARNPQDAQGQGQGGKPQGRRPAAPRDAYGNLMQSQPHAAPHESAPLFKMSRSELAQLELQRQARGQVVRGENGEPNGNVAEPKKPAAGRRKETVNRRGEVQSNPTGSGKRSQSENNRQQQAARRQEKAERLQGQGGEALQHERRFGNKNAAMPVADGEQSPREQRRAPAAGKPRAEGKSLVIKAKKLRLRSPSQDVKEKSKRLREVRLDKEQIEPVRLQKALSASGVGSRREMEEWIEAGLVLVNGKKASLGDRVGPEDRVTAKGDVIKLKWADRLPRIIMYHKQEGEIVSRDDPEGRVSVFERLPQAKSSRWVAVGRLDVNTSGLLLITTSGELANRMMHPSFEVEREYAVRVLGELTPEVAKEMTAGVELEDGPAAFQRVFQRGGAEEGANQWYNVVIKEGRNREVRRMFEHFGLTVSRLIRVRFGNLGLPPRLKRGQFYELNEAEVAAVMKWSDLTMTGRKKTRGSKAE